MILNGMNIFANYTHFNVIASELVIHVYNAKLNYSLYGPATISLPCLY